MSRNAVLLCLVSFLGMPVASAHDLRPIFVEISGDAGMAAVLRWKVPASVARNNLPDITLHGRCEPLGEVRLIREGDAYQGTRAYECPSGFSGDTLSLYFPAANPSLTTVIRASLGDGQIHTGLLSPGSLRWTVPERTTRWSVARSYTGLGVEHIWLGWDHLLFVACLIFVARTGRRILITITGFTVAHSLTLALSTLDAVSIPVPAVEAAIALSIVFVATEIVRGNQSTLTYRYPALVASSFGLLHGFGFASVLRDVGLPPTELPTALLFFNVGIEIGQVIFVLAVLGLARCYDALSLRPGSPLGRFHISHAQTGLWTAYPIGALASLWTMERILAFWV